MRKISLPTEPEPTAATCHPQQSGMPSIGEIVYGFRIVEKLGQGGFGSVYLGEQVGLADRLVALKFTSRTTSEPERLASLQHTNVVPVYSVHGDPPLQVLCMPYRGRQTLADAMRSMARTKSLPATGAGLLSTAPRAMEDTRRSKVAGRKTSVEIAPQLSPTETPQPIRDMLAKLSFPESVVWLIARLADGLAHAHDRGIVHLDLKPANVLITDDGIPMILDFGLAHDIRNLDYAVTGGTVRYMSPEQLEGFSKPQGFVPDRRMDLFAVGVVFFELLTGRHPYGDDAPGTSMTTLLAARKTVPQRVTAFNRNVSPAVAAVVAKLLEPDPADRYQSAHELLADLTRHQDSRPLYYAGNPSLPERLSKFRRRHPIATVATIAFFFATVAILSTFLAVRQSHQNQVMVADLDADQVQRELHDLRGKLSVQDETRQREDGLKSVSGWFVHYGIPEGPKWVEQSNVRLLASPKQKALQRTLGELAVLSAQAEEAKAAGKGPVERKEAFRRAMAWNRRAADCFAGQPMPPAVREQAWRLAERTGEAVPALSGEEAPVSAFDHYVRGAMQLSDGRFTAAVESLEKLAELEPGHAAGQLALGQAYHSLGRFNDALERMQLAKALCPTDARPCLHRGLILLHSGYCVEAKKEFDAAIRREPNLGVAYYHRAIVQSGLSDYDSAIADVTKAMELGEPRYRSLMLRARLHKDAKHPEAAVADLAEAGQQHSPQDEVDFLARGIQRDQAKDIQGALADFEKSAELNPRYVNAWQNISYILSERLGRIDDAIVTLDKAVSIAPEFGPARVGRAVLFARKKQRQAAHDDAQAALKFSKEPNVRYQIACTYALTSKVEPSDAVLAVQHLRQAFQSGFANFDLVDNDPDLEPIRANKDFQEAVKAAKQLRAE